MKNPNKFWLVLLAWADFGEWSSCSVTCGSGMRSRTRACKGGRPNDSGCPGSEFEFESCDTDVECEPVFESGGMFYYSIEI